MGCDMSKLKEKEKAHDAKVKADREKKKEEHHAKHHPEEAAKKEEAKAEKEAKAEVQKEAAEEKKAEAEVREDHHDAPAQQQQQEEEEAAAVAASDDAPREVADVATAEEQHRADIERDAYAAQEAIDRDHIEDEADTTSPLAHELQQQQQQETVSSRTVKRRPESTTPRPSHPSRAVEVERKVPTSATIFTKDGQQIDVAAEEAQQQPNQSTALTTVHNGELMPHPTKDTPTWKVMKPPQQDTSSWRLLRQVRMVFQMRNLTAI